MNDVTGATSGDGGLASTSWNLTTVFDGGEALASAGDTAVLEFLADGSLAGSTGCNAFSGAWEDVGAHLTIELGAMTRRACLDPATERQERLLTALLPAVRGYAVEGGTLTLRDAAGVPVLVYERGLTSLAGTRWRATGVNNGRGGLESTSYTHLAWVEFNADGSCFGSGGCNRFSGRYRSDGAAFAASDLVATRLLCDPPVMALEQQVFDGLVAATTYHVAGHRLELRDDAGAMQVTFELDPEVGHRRVV